MFDVFGLVKKGGNLFIYREREALGFRKGPCNNQMRNDLYFKTKFEIMCFIIIIF